MNIIIPVGKEEVSLLTNLRDVVQKVNFDCQEGVSRPDVN